MIDNRIGVATKLREASPFITSIHFITHRTNLVVLQVFKSNNCKEMSFEIDKIITYYLLILKGLKEKNQYFMLFKKN